MSCDDDDDDDTPY